METILNKESRAAIELMIADGLISKDTAERYFPELKESEDERIRKGIIRNLQYLADRAEGFVKDELEERIAWLEKHSSSQTKE